MEATIQQWGASLGLRIPKAYARRTKVKNGSRVQLSVEQGRLVVESVESKEIPLRSLLAKVTPENIHAETDWGKPMGKEIW